MSTFAQMKYCLHEHACVFHVFFHTEPFYQIHHRSRLIFFSVLGLNFTFSFEILTSNYHVAAKMYPFKRRLV